ncbi:hypothetical protein KACC15558_22880 [Brevibacterium ammoniilyticum]|uniref:Uncharacterized protein n=1 Tax=Brevibacterium ammoniilyticum TaxID=1046555 RepID=A0ABP9U0U7_9MICO
MSTTLQDLVNRAVFLSTETQTHFGGLIADAAWEVDFTADPHLTFTAEDDAVLRTRPHLLGSESSSQGTWLWGWENINEFPEAVVGLSHEVRKFGAASDIDELVSPELKLDDELALRLTLAAKEATGKWAHYPAAAGAGTTVWLLVDAPELTLPEPTVKASVRALMQGLTQTTVDDHRAALEAYVAKRGIPTAPLPENGLRLLFADGSADLSFDEVSRISNCEVHAPLEGEAAEQFSRITGITVADASSPGATAAASATAESTTTDSTTAREDSAAAASGGPSGSEHTAASSATGRSADTADEAVAPAAETSRPDASPAASSEATAEHRSDGVPAEAAAPSGTAEHARSESPRTEDDESAASAEPATEEPEAAEEPKKKGLFSRLFGR